MLKCHESTRQSIVMPSDLPEDFTPRVGNGELPDLADYTNLTAATFQAAVLLWNQLLTEYENLLYAKPIGNEELFLEWDEHYEPDYYYYERTHEYHDREEDERIRDRVWVQIRDAYTDALYDVVAAHCYSLILREITLQQWYQRMAETIRDAHTAMFMFGRGGYNRIIRENIDSVIAAIRTQFDYLLGFAQDIIRRNFGNFTDDFGAQGLITPFQPLSARRMVNRSALYVESSTASAEHGRATTYGILPDTLPEYPGDGNQICLSRCRCHWRIVPTDDPSILNAYWRLNPFAKHCGSCLGNASAYNPFILGV